jgi:phage baseplate assembly protein V
MSDDEIIRSWLRAHNSHGIVTLHRVDDTNPVQSAQIEGYQTEIRDGMQRHQQFGISTVPLPGSKGYATYQSGHRGAATVLSVEDPRYRPTNQQPGEILVYMVDNAKADGTGGTMRALLKGALKWATQLFGMTIAIGDSNTSTVTIMGLSLIKLVGNVEITGNLQVDGNTTLGQVVNGVVTGGNLNILGNETGGGSI